MKTEHIGNHKTTVVRENGFTRVKYHNTNVFWYSHEGGNITLRHNGWTTDTTKRRMNQAFKEFDFDGYVYQRNYQWYVDFAGNTYKFPNTGCLKIDLATGKYTDSSDATPDQEPTLESQR